MHIPFDNVIIHVHVHLYGSSAQSWAWAVDTHKSIARLCVYNIALKFLATW